MAQASKRLRTMRRIKRHNTLLSRAMQSVELKEQIQHLSRMYQELHSDARYTKAVLMSVLAHRGTQEITEGTLQTTAEAIEGNVQSWKATTKKDDPKTLVVELVDIPVATTEAVIKQDIQDPATSEATVVETVDA